MTVEGLDAGASPLEVCAYKAVLPFAGGVVIGEVSVAKLVDEIQWALKVGKGHWMGYFKWFEHFFLEHYSRAVPRESMTGGSLGD